MEGRLRFEGGLAALIIAMSVGILLAATQRSEGPSRAELAQALIGAGEIAAKTTDLRDVRCSLLTEGYSCNWRQRVADRWRERTGVVRADGKSWQMAEPFRPVVSASASR